MIRKTWFSLLVLVVTVVCASSQAGFFWRTKEARTRPVVRRQLAPHSHPSFGYHQTQWRRFPGVQYSEVVIDSAGSVPHTYEPEGIDAHADPAPVEQLAPIQEPVVSEPSSPSEPVEAAEPAAPAQPAEDQVEPVKQKAAAVTSDPIPLRPRIPLPPAEPATGEPSAPRVLVTPVSTPWRSSSSRLPVVRPGM